MKCDVNLMPLLKLKYQLEDFAGAVANNGADNARSIYSNKVYVGVEKGENSYTIVSKGFTMPFEEYGAGSMAIAGRVGGVVVGEDTWSREHKQEYHRWGYWTHNGQRYYFILPKYAMHKTVTKLKNETMMYAKRYFK